MARKKIESIVCDRCERVVEEVDAVEGETILAEDVLSAFVLESKFGNATFDDLCEKCDKRVADLIGQVLMESKEAKKDEKKDADKPKADEVKAESKKPEEKKVEEKKPEEKTSPSKGSKDGFSDFA